MPRRSCRPASRSRAVAEYLGHSPAELLKTYAHLMPADHDRARAVQGAFDSQGAEDLLRTSNAPSPPRLGL